MIQMQHVTFLLAISVFCFRLPLPIINFVFTNTKVFKKLKFWLTNKRFRSVSSKKPRSQAKMWHAVIEFNWFKFQPITILESNFIHDMNNAQSVWLRDNGRNTAWNNLCYFNSRVGSSRQSTHGIHWWHFSKQKSSHDSNR